MSNEFSDNLRKTAFMINNYDLIVSVFQVIIIIIKVKNDYYYFSFIYICILFLLKKMDLLIQEAHNKTVDVELDHVKQILSLHITGFVDEQLKPYFGGMIDRVKQWENKSKLGNNDQCIYIMLITNNK